MKSPDNPSHAWMVLNALPHIGPVNTRRLLDHFGNCPSTILNAQEKALMEVKGIGGKAATTIRNWNEYFDLDKELSRVQEYEVDFITSNEDRYSQLLLNIYDPPLGVYLRGNPGLLNHQPAIAIVGSRNTTLYGTRIARQFAQRLATAGVCVVSGLARGIDTAAHEGALEAGGATIAVLGNGIDIVYPPENLDLYRRIIESGAVISEFCFGRRADRQTFPMRNRIVSGLCEGVLVVESDERGGSMITARFAGEQGRQVYAIPGRIDQASSRGCHQLIKDGAVLTTSIEDILDDLRYKVVQGDLFGGVAETETEAAPTNVQKPSFDPSLSGTATRMLDCLHKQGALTVDELAEELDLEIHELNSTLLMLELRKLVAKQIDGTFELR